MNFSIILSGISFILALFPAIYYIIDILFRLRDKEQKQLTTEIISKFTVVNIDKEIDSDIYSTYKGKSIRNVNEITLRIKNTGNQSIDKSDYDVNSQVKFDFGDKTEVLAVWVLETEPDSLRGIINIVTNPDPGKVVINPLLLNENESITLKVYVNGFENKIRDETRLRGVRQIFKFRIPMKPSLRNLGISMISILILSPLLLPLISEILYNNLFYLLTSVDSSRNYSDYLFISFPDTLGAILIGILMSFTYPLIVYFIPEYIETRTTRIDLTSRGKLPKRKVVLLASISMILYVIGYGIVTLYFSAYIQDTFHYQVNISQIILLALNAADVVASFIAGIIVFLFIVLLNRLLPLKA
mgnify:CR=1 FL=1